MIKNKKIKILSFLGMPCLIVTPLIISSCSYKNVRNNFVTTYDNVLDDAIALGIKPNYATPGNWTTYTSKYIRELAEKANTKILDWRIFPKGEGSLNPREVTKLGIDLLGVNITDSGKESVIKNYVNNVAYTGRGDSKEYSYVGDKKVISNGDKTKVVDELGGIDFYNDSGKRVWVKDNGFVEAGTDGSSRVDKNFQDYGFNYKLFEWQQNPFAALSKFAKSLDNLSGGKNNFSKKSEEIEKMQKNRLTELNNNDLIKSNVNNKTIAFILGKKASSNSNDAATNIQIYSPHTYPQFYSRQNDKGLKMNFPAPKEATSVTSGIMFNDPDIIAGDNNDMNTFKNASGGQKLIEQFQGKFDYVVYMAYDAGEFQHTKDEVVKSDLSKLLKTTMSNDQTNKEKHIFYTSYSDMYMSTWGPIGQSLGISKFVEWINTNFGNETNKKIVEKKENILFDKVNNNDYLSNLKEWKQVK